MRARAWLVGVQVLTRGSEAPHEARCWEVCGCAALKACMHGGREKSRADAPSGKHSQLGPRQHAA